MHTLASSPDCFVICLLTVEFIDRVSGQVVYSLTSTKYPQNTRENRCKLLNTAYQVGSINFNHPDVSHRFSASPVSVHRFDGGPIAPHLAQND